MKKNIWMASALVCALAVATVSCNNEEFAGTSPDVDGQRTTITAKTPQSGADTRISYDETDAAMKLAWEKNDAIGMWKAGETTVNRFTATQAGASTDFTSTGGVSFETNDQLYAVYPKPATVAADNKTELDLSTAQTGVLNKANHYMYASALWQENTANFTFKHAVSILKLELNFSGVSVTPSSLKSVKLSATGLHSKATLTMSGSPTIEGTVEGDITASGTFSNGTPIYLYVFPEDLKDIKIKATDGVFIYEGALTDKVIEAGKMYTATITMTQSGPEFYYKNGTHSLTYQGTSDNPCIGIVIDAKKGLILSDQLDCGKISWATEDAGYVVTETTNASGKDDVVLLKKLSPTLSQYPAAQACDNYAVGEKGWYLPSRTEVEVLMNKNDQESAAKWASIFTTAGFKGTSTSAADGIWTTTVELSEYEEFPEQFAYITAMGWTIFAFPFKYEEPSSEYLQYVRCVKKVTL